MRFSTCKRKKGEQPVQSGLALTPSQMMAMAERGVPISAQTASDSEFDLGAEAKDCYLPLERTRGIDIADLWVAERSAKKKMADALKTEKIASGNFKTINPINQ